MMIVSFSNKALKELKKLDKNLSVSIIAALKNFANNQPSDYKKLKGFPNRYRIRVRDYRTVFDVIIQDNVIYVLRVAHRQEVYKNINDI